MERKSSNDSKKSDGSSNSTKIAPFKPASSVFGGGAQVAPAFLNYDPAKTSRIDNLASKLAKKKKLKRESSDSNSGVFDNTSEYSNIPKAFRPPSVNNGSFSRSHENLINSTKPKTPQTSPEEINRSPTLPQTSGPSIQTTQDLENFIKTQVEACISKMVDGGKLNTNTVNADVMNTIKRQLVQKAAQQVPNPQNTVSNSKKKSPPAKNNQKPAKSPQKTQKLVQNGPKSVQSTVMFG